MKKRTAYTGDNVPLFVPVCMYEGYIDSRLMRSFKDNLYRYPWHKRLGWAIGYFIGLLFHA